MASETDILNMGLVLLGEARVSSLDDNVKQAREGKAIYPISRDALISNYNWIFAMARTSLAALDPSQLNAAQLAAFPKGYQLPADCLRVVFIDDHYTGIDLTDYRGAPTQEYQIEGRYILTGLPDPLYIRYMRGVTQTGLFPACFTRALACQLASDLAEVLTQSVVKKKDADEKLMMALRAAVRENAIQLPPEKLPADEWEVSRL